MSKNTCFLCRRPKAIHDCEVCHELVCKSCSHFLPASTFSFWEQIGDALSYTRYCLGCYQENVEPALETYKELMESAKGVYFFFVTQKRPLPVLKSGKDLVSVPSCEDRNETILRLAFKAVEQGYNAIIQGELVSTKLRNEGYQTSVWKGTGRPALLDVEKMERRSE